ncbi:NAD(P)/FAD-dependent oxidoreductase [Dehalococcoides mccartyi]|uniref:NAD(P)/FAD-dependent oxidoreductase n=1 Tax=Dehalococcoides mccartyi TaxID=61435 RepID=UPI0003C89C10|nr:NAD(P)/FAD-dependent oxidoreductase [Dehalococcoides mccartyi]AHB13436.1 FAD/NAD(P)-binding oxidoreductase [Dehalococcoides mccartyi GY50]
MNTDILVIGAGPVGIYTAKCLAQRGYEVRLLEKRPEMVKQICCTGLISTECAAIYGFHGEYIQNHFSEATVYSPYGRKLLLKRDTPQAIMLDRGGFQAGLLKQAVNCGVQTNFGCQVNDLENTGNGICITTKGGQTFFAKAAVLAAGYNTELSRAAGLGEIKHFAFGLQREVDTSIPIALSLFTGKAISQGYFGWLSPINDHAAKMGLLTRKNPNECWSILHNTIYKQGLIPDRNIKYACRPVPAGNLSASFGDRVLAVGDFAGQLKPTTGGGIYFGLLCADLAVACLDKKIKTNKLSKADMAEYEKSWKALIGSELYIGKLLSRIYAGLDDRLLEQIFKKCAANGMIEKMAAKSHLGFDWHGKAFAHLLKNPLDLIRS